ncbi:hypothetical protein ACFXKC_32000 [Streptomyces sp. NPDC059340]|uniref:hypothetical protein n=1 Tax=Streptomyces sp. NPDC059340 TaxID=3346806 RepID=UPI0036B35320
MLSRASPYQKSPAAALAAEIKRLVHGFAMAGELALLACLLREETVEARAQAMSAWWTTLPQHLRVDALS